MEGFCCTLLSMSLAAALTALGVMVARLFLYKLPRAPGSCSIGCSRILP